MLFLLDPPDDPVWFQSVPPGMPAPAPGGIDTRRHLSRMQTLSTRQKLAYAAGKLFGHLQSKSSRAILNARCAYARACRRTGVQIPAGIRKLYVNRVYLRACKAYGIRNYPGPVLVFRSTEGALDEDCRLWQLVSGERAEILTFDCTHHQMQRDPQVVADWTSAFADRMQKSAGAPQAFE